MAKDDPLVRLVSDAIAANDPLDPWLVVSNYDANYWDDVARAVAENVRQARSEAEVFAALAEGLADVVTISDDEPYARDRIAVAARVIWADH